jgi:hypothetical protein
VSLFIDVDFSGHNFRPPLFNTKDIELISRQQLIEDLGINASTLWRWEKQGKIKRAGGIGNKVYYNRRAVEYAITKNA